MLKGKGKFFIRHPRRPGGTIAASIHVSARLVRDSQFPFRHKDRLNIRLDVENQALIITKREEQVAEADVSG